jgi:hypothetical protein
VAVGGFLTASVFPGVDDGSCNGQTFAVATGGESPYSYQWNDPQSQTSSTASNLCAGTYTCVVTDQNGCDISVQSAIFSNTTSIEELFAATEFSLFPNPASESMTLRCESPFELGRIHLRILSLSGKLVQIQTVDFSSTNQVMVSLEELQDGVYFVELEKEGVRLQRIILKE